ncbi:bifunctional aldolase/short-chain dehydrogenase [candidate division KSB1 bacterium]
MKNLWDNKEAVKYKNDPLGLRVYSSRLLGSDELLVSHGGGNTSVKSEAKDIFGKEHEVLYVKGSGWDLASIEKEGFAPVKMEVLKQMIELDFISDTDMVKTQRAAMLDPSAPNPSVEALLHAVIPFRFVDHTHADYVVTITNNDSTEKILQEIYGDKILVIPYYKAGFILAKKAYEQTRKVNWDKIEGMVLLNHGIFTFHDDAEKSYTRMIDLVQEAETYLDKKKAYQNIAIEKDPLPEIRFTDIAKIRKNISETAGKPMLGKLLSGEKERGFSNLSNVQEISRRGPLTPDHVFRAKRIPVVFSKDINTNIRKYSENYEKYFEKNKDNGQQCLDPAPRWGVWPGKGLLVFGGSIKDLDIVSGIARHTIEAIQWGEAIGGWKALSEKDIFDIEYWELEQAKLRLDKKSLLFQGKTVLVTGAASGIGRACAKSFAENGAVVAAIDINPGIETMFEADNILGIVCDVTDDHAIKDVLKKLILNYGGLDILVTNAGTFPKSSNIEDLDDGSWEKSMNLNLTSHQKVMRACIPYLKYGIEPAVVVMASKNVPAPGPGAAAYSVAKAGLTQLARVAALELGQYGIRVNIIHGNMIFDTGIWTKEVLEGRAKHYGMTVEEYKTNNLLRTEITSKNVAELAMAMAGPAFAKTTCAQVPIDGGNERVI